MKPTLPKYKGKHLQSFFILAQVLTYLFLFSLFFIGLILGTLISEVCVSGRLSDWLVLRLAKKNDGIKTAEMRLWIVYPGAVLSSIGMLVWGLSVDKNWHWAVGQVALLLCKSNHHPPIRLFI